MEQTNEKKEMKKNIILVIILVVIVAAVISILFYQKKSVPELDEIKKIPLETQIAEYEGEDVPGANVKLMLAKILSEELENSKTSLEKFEYNYRNDEQDLIEEIIKKNSDNKSENIQKIVKLRNFINNEDIYEIKYEKENGAITFISIKIKESK